MLETSTNDSVITQLSIQPSSIETGPSVLDLVAETHPRVGGELDVEVDPDISVAEACAIAECDKSVINGRVREGKLSQRPDRAGQRMVLKSEILVLKEYLAPRRRARGAKKAASIPTPATSHPPEVELAPCETIGRGNELAEAAPLEIAPSTETAEGQMLPESVVATPDPTPLASSSSSADGSPTTAIEKVSLATISFDETLQVRARIHNDVVSAYATLMRSGQQFPPVDLFNGKTEMFIGDGWHRLLAAKKIGYHTFPARVHPGGRIAALRWALQANATHGVRLTRTDLAKKVGIALEQYPKMSSNEIAKICAVSEGLVRKLRPRFVLNERDLMRIGADGKSYPARKTSNMVGARQGENPLFNKAVKLAERLALESLQRLQGSIAALIEEKLKCGTALGTNPSTIQTTNVPSTPQE